jgi:hypothetical protein
MPTAAPGPWLDQALARGLIDPAQLLPRARAAEPPVTVTTSLVVAPLLDCREKDFMAAVIALAKSCGWRYYHTHDSRLSAAGFPDLVLVRGGVLVFAELKAATGKPTPDQHAWLDALAAVPGVHTHLWRPADWPEIVAALMS